MNRPRWWLVIPALLASAVLGAAQAGEVRDKAALFSTEAVQKAQSDLDRLEKEYEVPVTIETVETLNGETVGEVTTKHAQAVNARGIYLLVAKKESKIYAEASRDYRKYITRDRLKTVEAGMIDEFKKRDFDAGLTQGVAKFGSIFSDAKSEAGGSIRQSPVAKTRRGGVAAPVRQAPAANRNSWGGMSLISIILGILAVLFVLRMLGALFGAMRGNAMGGGGGGMMGGRGYGPGGQGGPGYGGGGYGGAPAGGGGFMSSLFGGIGGAMAGNYLYDQFSGRGHNSGGVDQTGVDAGAGAAPIEDAGPEWGVGGAEADYGGTTTDNSAGGDWGGGGGGDWGGGGGDAGGGGDWGGGGGGDDGGSW